jgi:hypothetical protein
MTSIRFAWGVALVATLGLLGGVLAYPDPYASVSNDEAAALVGGTNCDCWSRWNCAAPYYCTDAIWLTLTGGYPCDRPNTYGYNSIKCGTGPCSCTNCASGFSDVGPCIVSSCPPPAP